MSDNSPSAVRSAYGVVVIGRNEGERLIACLDSIGNNVPVVYVDSGSTDGSQDAAIARDADVLSLDMSLPFTAARARNAGFARLCEIASPRYVQFVDGDCEIDSGWMQKAERYLNDHENCAAVCGRRREKYPTRTIYNALCDREWATPIGEAEACGGDVMIRVNALEKIGGYNPTLIAGEEPEMCVRLREAGYIIARIDEEMTRHDIAMTSINQWMRRARRAGHAFAEVSHIHRDSAKRIWARETKRALLWSSLLPIGALAGIIFFPLGFLLWLIYPLQIIRLAMRNGGTQLDWAEATLNTVSKFAEAAGIIMFTSQRLTGRRTKLLEYKT